MKSIPVKPVIKFSELEKIDIRVGRIESLDEVPGSDKLVRLIVNFGDFKRKILVGMKKERANPAEVVGKQALFVVNLEPKKMAGEESNGMLFDLGYANEITPVLVCPEVPVPDGAVAG